MYVYVGKCTDNSWYDTSRDNTKPIFQIYTYLYSILPILVSTTDFCMYLNLNYSMVLCELYTVQSSLRRKPAERNTNVQVVPTYTDMITYMLYFVVIHR